MDEEGHEASSASASRSTNNRPAASSVPPSDSHNTAATEPDVMDSILPIKWRGFFFEDDFFDKSRGGFEDAMQDVLKRCGTSGSSDRGGLRDDLARYRNIREQDLSEKSQAACVKQDDDGIKITVDMQEFLSGQMQVKTEGKYAVLEANTAPAGSTPNPGDKQFSRRWQMPPDADMGAITAALSSDGILNIHAPLKGKRKSGEGAGIGETCEMKATSEQSATPSQQSRPSLDSFNRKTGVASHFPSDPFDSLWSEKQRGGMFGDRDSFLDDARKDFESRVKNMEDDMRRRREERRSRSTLTDRMADILSGHHDTGAFRSSLVREPMTPEAAAEQDTKAAIFEDENSYKVRLDVKSAPESLSVKAEQGRVVIEGGVGPAVSGQLRRRITLPPLPNAVPHEASASLSQDGTLTVTVPKCQHATSPAPMSPQSSQFASPPLSPTSSESQKTFTSEVTMDIGAPDQN